MSLTVSCPFCKTNLKVPDNGAGKKVRCPRCGTPVRVPAEVETESDGPRRSGPPHQR